MGRGAESAFLGVHAGHPGFAMMALDGSVFVCASTGETGIDVLAVRRPARSENILRQLEWIARHDAGRPGARRRGSELPRLLPLGLGGEVHLVDHSPQVRRPVHPAGPGVGLVEA